MILRALLRLLSLAALAVVGFWIHRVFTAPGPARPRGARTGPSQGTMVRDRVCDTFLPRSSALQVTIDGRTHYFCSEACRRRFLAAPESTKTA